MAVQIQLRNDTAANWASENPVLAVGEIGVESDTSTMKVGNGSTAWNSLEYFGVSSTYVDNAISNLVDSSPTTLDTLNELAAALGDDPNFATTISNQIATKLSTTTYEETAAPSSVYSVISNGTAAYSIEGVDNPTLSLVRGQKYVFDINASGHPFHIQTVTGAYSSADVYTTGVTGDGTEVGKLVFEVPLDAPETLYYVCEFHSAMQGVINIESVDKKANALSSVTSTASNIAIDSTYLNKTVLQTSTSNRTFTLEAGLPVGGHVDFINMSTGILNFTAGTGVTLLSAEGALTIDTQYKAASIVVTSPDTYVLVGAIA